MKKLRSAPAPIINKRARIRARRSAVQGLYQWFMTGKDVGRVISEFESNKQAKLDLDYFKVLLRGTIKETAELDAHVATLLDRPIAELDLIEHAILHIGCYELQHHLEIPWRVVVNESVELAKLFGAEGSHKYINGVLDQVARKLRTAEIKNIH